MKRRELERNHRKNLILKGALKAYSKKRFDPFCRWDRITIPYKNDTYIQTTIGQLNFLDGHYKIKFYITLNKT